MLIVLGGIIVAATTWGRQTDAASPHAGSGLTATLAVEVFHVGDPAPRSWTAVAFAESLAARLSRMPGLTVRLASDSFAPRTGFTIRGDVSARDGRLVIATRLYRRGGEDALWTATFWRTDSLTSDLVSDLAAAVAEAVYGQLARSAMTTTGERP